MTDYVIYGRVEGLEARVSELERVLAELASTKGITVAPPSANDAGSAGDQQDNDPTDEEIAALLRAGKRAQAVSFAAKSRGVSIADASAIVGRIEGSL